MRDKHYKIRAIRISDKVWEELIKEKIKSGLSWNLFLKEKLGHER